MKSKNNDTVELDNKELFGHRTIVHYCQFVHYCQVPNICTGPNKRTGRQNPQTSINIHGWVVKSSDINKHCSNYHKNSKALTLFFKLQLRFKRNWVLYGNKRTCMSIQNTRGYFQL